MKEANYALLCIDTYKKCFCFQSMPKTVWPDKHFQPCYRKQRSCGKVMILHLSVILFTGCGVCHTHFPLGKHPPWANTPPRADTPCEVHAGIWSTSGWYASYWNAILLLAAMKLWSRKETPPPLGKEAPPPPAYGQ